MGFTSVQEKLDFVRAQCRTIPNAKHYENYTMIRCPFHSDKNPSGRIFHSSTSRVPGFFKCYGCGATASWNELAPVIGCLPFESKPSVRYSTHLDLNLETDESTEDLIMKPLPHGKVWRGIQTNLLIDIGCSICRVRYDNGLSDKFIYMPVRVGGELKGYTKARLKKEKGQTSYINKAGSWVHKFGLFPFDYSISMLTSTKTIVLVEGQRDALRLISNGIPSLCIMGTQNWSDEKAQLLELNGVERAIIFMDGDDAGIAGAKKVWASLKRFMECKVVKLWKIKGSPYIQFKDFESPSKEAKNQNVELWDPFNCPQWIIDRIKKLYID